MDKNKKLCELLGIHWIASKPSIEICDGKNGGRCKIIRDPADQNPDFLSDSGRIELLRIMEKREDWLDFQPYVIWDRRLPYLTEPKGGTKLVDAVIGFLESRKAEGGVNMSEDRIDIGDKVNVVFVSSGSLFRCEVLHKPTDVGDSWCLKDEDGWIHNVLLFERMDKIV